MKKSKRILSLLLVLVTALGIITPLASAADLSEYEQIIIVPQYLRINTLNPDLTISSSGRSTSSCTTSLKNTTDTCELTMTLQKKSGSSWSTVKSWTKSGSLSLGIEQDWYVTAGYSYRVKVVAKIYSSSGTLVETVTEYSNTVAY